MAFKLTSPIAARKAFCLAVAFFAATPGALSDSIKPQAPSAEAQQVAAWLEGRFDSSEQASQDADYLPVSLKSCLVTVMDDQTGALGDALYLYVEQAIMGREQTPYRQRIYRIADADPTLGSSTVESEILLLATPARFVSFCSVTQASRVVARQDIETRGCSVFLTLKPDGESEGAGPGAGDATVANRTPRFVGTTPQGGCPSSFNGATTAESYVSLGAESLIAWDIGRDAAGNQVWGPEKGPYIFKRKGN
jgi:hypothetical protein